MTKILKVGVGQSKNPKEAIKMAMQKTANPVLTIIFSSSNNDPYEVYNTIKEEVGDSQIIGGTTAGEFSSVTDAPMTGSVAVMTLESHNLQVGVGVGQNLSESPFICGKNAVNGAFSSLKENPTASALMSMAFMKKHNSEIIKIKPFINIVIPDGLSCQEEGFLRGITSEVGTDVYLIGGSTGDDLKYKKTYQFANGVYTNAGVVATLHSALKIGTSTGHPFYPTSKGAIVTKSDGRIIYELNHRPAAEVMKELLEVDELTTEIFIQNPMGIKSADIFGEYIIKGAMYANKDGSITFHAEIPENNYMAVMATDREYAINSFKKTIQKAINDAGIPKKKIGAIIIFNCVLKNQLENKLGINNMDIIKENWGDVPVIGYNTYGEQGHTLGGSIVHHNLVSTVLIIGDESISQ